MLRRGLDGTLLRFLEIYESKCALIDVHKDICRYYSNGLTLARKLIRVGYYWLNIEQEATKYAKSWKKC